MASKQAILQAVRAHCRECVGTPQAVEGCGGYGCRLYPYRMGDGGQGVLTIPQEMGDTGPRRGRKGP